jgi:hypothetical protein
MTDTTYLIVNKHDLESRAAIKEAKRAAHRDVVVLDYYDEADRARWEAEVGQPIGFIPCVATVHAEDLEEEVGHPDPDDPRRDLPGKVLVQTIAAGTLDVVELEPTKGRGLDHGKAELGRRKGRRRPRTTPAAPAATPPPRKATP